MDRIRKVLIKSHHGRGRAHTTSKQWTEGSFSTHGIRNTFGNTTSRNDSQLPPIPQSIYINWSFDCFLAFCLNKPCYNDFFSTFLSPRGQVLFSTALNFMEKHSDFAVLLLLKDYYHQWTDPTKGQDPSPQSGRTQTGSQTYTNP